jgi:ribosomal protein S18 acetylase RimI-like enzyme
MNLAGLSLYKIPNSAPIPYELLLLADESTNAIDKYVHDCKSHLVKYHLKTIGVCAIQEIESQTIEIKNLAIINDYQNKGIGSWCLQEIEKIYKRKYILVGTGDSSLDALRFYKRNGFEQDAIRKDYFLANYDQAIIENGIQLRDQIVLKKTLIY